MTNNNDKKKREKKYERSLNVAAFLGGITLTVFVLLIDNPPIRESPISNIPIINFIVNFIHQYILLGLMGLVSSLFIMSVFGLKVSLVRDEENDDNKENEDKFSKFSFKCY